jgi:hypothetical protein
MDEGKPAVDLRIFSSFFSVCHDEECMPNDSILFGQTGHIASLTCSDKSGVEFLMYYQFLSTEIAVQLVLWQSI